MAVQVNESRLRLTAEDATGRGMASAARNIRQTAKEAEDAARRLSAVQNRIATAGGQLGAGLGIGLSIAGAARAAKDSFGEFARYDRMLTTIGITADASAEDMAKVGAKLKEMAGQYALPLDTMAEGLDALVSGGKNLQEAMAFLPTVAATAQASGASIRDISTSADALGTHLGFTAGQMQHAMDILAKGGKAGKFELRDMAQYLPQLAPLAAAIGYKGEEGLQKLVAILQVVRKGTGDAGQAADATRDMFAKMGSQEVIQKFNDFGGDLGGRLLQWRQEGGDTFGKFVKFTRDLVTERAKAQNLKDPLELLPNLFGDIAMQNGMRALLSQPGAVRELAGALQTVDGTVMADLARKQADAAASTQRLATAFLSVEQAAGKMLDRMHVTGGLEWLADKLMQAAKGAENIAEKGFLGSTRRGLNIRAYNDQVEEYRGKQEELKGAKTPAEKSRIQAELKELEERLEIKKRILYETGTEEDKKSLYPNGLPALPVKPKVERPADPEEQRLRREAEEAAAQREALRRKPGAPRDYEGSRAETRAEFEKQRTQGQLDQYLYNRQGAPGIDGIQVENPRGSSEDTQRGVLKGIDNLNNQFKQYFNPSSLHTGTSRARFQRASYGDGAGSDPVGDGHGGSGVPIGGSGGDGGRGGGGAYGSGSLRYGTQRGGSRGGIGGGSGAPAGPGGVRGGRTAPTTAQGKANVASWLAFAQRPVDQGGLGLSAEQAHGMVAGMQGESGVNLNAGAYNPNDRGMPSGGTMQWRAERLQALKEFAAARGDTANNGLGSVETQQQYQRHEFLGSGGRTGGSERRAYEAMKGETTREGALKQFVAKGERPQFPGPEIQKRSAYLYGHGGNDTGTPGMNDQPGATADGQPDTSALRVKGGPGGQAFAGGETRPGTLAAARDAQMYGLPGGVKQFTAFNDAYHAGTNSKHASGLAFDTTLNENTAEAYAAAAVKMRERLKEAGLSDSDFKVIDERANPSARSTGAHLHTQFNSPEAAAQYNQFSARKEAERVAAEKGKAEGKAQADARAKADPVGDGQPKPEAAAVQGPNRPEDSAVQKEKTAFERWMEKRGKAAGTPAPKPANDGMSEVSGPIHPDDITKLSPFANEKNKPKRWVQDPETERWKPDFKSDGSDVGKDPAPAAPTPAGDHIQRAEKAKAEMRAALGDTMHVDIQPRIANAERLRDRTKAQSRREVDREVRDARLNTYSDVGVG